MSKGGRNERSNHLRLILDGADILDYNGRTKAPKREGVVWNRLIAGVAELVDARDLKSLGSSGPCRFESGLRHF